MPMFEQQTIQSLIRYKNRKKHLELIHKKLSLILRLNLLKNEVILEAILMKI